MLLPFPVPKSKTNPPPSWLSLWPQDGCNSTRCHVYMHPPGKDILHQSLSLPEHCLWSKTGIPTEPSLDHESVSSFNRTESIIKALNLSLQSKGKEPLSFFTQLIIQFPLNKFNWGLAYKCVAEERSQKKWVAGKWEKEKDAIWSINSYRKKKCRDRKNTLTTSQRVPKIPWEQHSQIRKGTNRRTTNWNEGFSKGFQWGSKQVLLY